MDSVKNEKLMFLTLLIGGFVTVLSTSTINIALPNFITIFNTDLNSARWTITGFMLSTGVIAPITCFLGEKYSYKRIFLIAITGFILSSVGCMASPNIESLVFFRILQGIFNGLTLPTTMSIIYQVVPRQRQAVAMSLWTFALMIAPAIGPTISGWLIEYFSWKAIFVINLPLGLITLVLIYMTIPSYRLNDPQGVDIPGFVTSIIATTSLLVAFSNVSFWGWTSIKTLTLFAIGAVSLALFIRRELTTATPMLELSIFKYRTFSITIIIRGVITMALYAGSLLTPLFLQNAQHASALDAGLVMLPPSIMMAITTIIIGRIYNKTNPVILIRIGIISLAIGSFMLAQTSLDTTHLYIIGGLIFRNVGIAFTLTTATMYGMASLAKEVAGNGSSLNNWVTQSIGCFSISVFTSILSVQRMHHLKELSESARELMGERALVGGVNDVYLISTLIVIVALILSVLFETDKRAKGDMRTPGEFDAEFLAEAE